MNKKCQVFTPHNNVIEILDRVGYCRELYGRKVIENACGDGNILKEIVKRYIEDCLKNNISLINIKNGLQRDIYGAEIDKKHFKKCLKNLDSVASIYKIHNVKWNILNKDILKEKLGVEFDFVIGNPPYIKYRDLDEETRQYVKENYESCAQGKFDYCYAFIEASLKCLNENGKMAYLIPSNIFKNVFAQKLREMMIPYLAAIYDYTTFKLFDKKLTSSAIMILNKGKSYNKIEYFDVVKSKRNEISKKDLNGKWVFSHFTSQSVGNKYRFGDLFNASLSIATLLNEAFIINNFEITEEYLLVDGLMIEKEIIRDAASPRSLNYKKSEKIIFPYYYDNNSLIRYAPKKFEDKFPGAVNHLKKYTEKLSKRDSDKNVYWYEYGRSQALAHLNQKKLLTSTLVTKNVKVYTLTEECIPYSGIYITSKGEFCLDKAKKILQSLNFYEYVKSIGINASGDSIRITAGDINNYEFRDEEVL